MFNKIYGIIICSFISLILIFQQPLLSIDDRDVLLNIDFSSAIKNRDGIHIKDSYGNYWEVNWRSDIEDITLRNDGIGISLSPGIPGPSGSIRIANMVNHNGTTHVNKIKIIYSDYSAWYWKTKVLGYSGNSNNPEHIKDFGGNGKKRDVKIIKFTPPLIYEPSIIIRADGFAGVVVHRVIIYGNVIF